MPATSDWDKKHQRNLSSYEREVDAMFDTAVKEAARIADIIRELKGEKPFSFDDYPEAKKRVNKLLERLTRNVTTSVVSGIRSEWTLANEKNNELCNRVFGDKVDDLTEAQRRQYYTTNSKARQAFEQRRVNGLNLSDRVWNYTSQFKEEIEWGLDIGLREGRSAAEMARDLKQYLKYPDKLFRRVRDEHGNLRLSRNAKAFHPGMGVYRSSYKNARRLAVTETNMAYRTSDYERWQKLDFVVGMHIIRSNNHTTTDSKGKRVKLVDICDELSGENERDTKGRYPKSFKFTGWHPQCRCYAVSILKTEEERREDRRRRLAGEEPLPASSSVNYVGDVPQEFKTWVAENSERINTAKSLPYFISDNRNVVDGLLEATAKNDTKKEKPATLQHLDEVIDKFQYTDPQLKAREGEINEMMKELFDNNDFGMHVKSKTLESIFEKGFLNTFQTGTSGGYEGSTKTTGAIETNHSRLVSSHRMFSTADESTLIFPAGTKDSLYTGKQLERSEYEKFGLLLDKEDRMKAYYMSSALQYGDAQVRFKKDKVTCTWTFDNSLEACEGQKYSQPSLVTDPRVESFNQRLHYSSVDDFIDNSSRKSELEFRDKNSCRYIELQYHGQVTIDDVESITWGFGDPSEHISKELIKKLEEKGIELWYNSAPNTMSRYKLPKD